MPKSTPAPPEPSASPPQQAQKGEQAPSENEAKRWFGWLIGAIISIIAQQMLGGNFWVPALSVAFSFWLVRKAGYRDAMLAALAIPAGHALWFFIAFGILTAFGLNGQAIWSLVECALITALLVWISRAQSQASFSTLVAYQAIALLVNLWALTEATTSSKSGALLVHISLRLLSAGFSIRAANQVHERRVIQRAATARCFRDEGSQDCRELPAQAASPVLGTTRRLGGGAAA